MSVTVAALGAALAGAGAIANWMGSREANKRAKEAIDNQRSKNDAWWNIKKNQDATRRADNQAVINQQRELLNDANYLTRATNKVSGGSEEAVALQKEATNKAAAQTMSNIAAQGAAERERNEAQYRATDAALDQQEIQRQQQKAAQNAAAGAQAVNAGLNLVANEARDLDTTKKPKTTATAES